MVTLADLDVGFLSHKIRQQLERISLLDEDQVIGVSGEDAVTVLAVANHLAKNWVPFTYDSALSDIHWCDPGEKGWLFENIDNIIVNSLSLQPINRHILIIQGCDTFTIRGWDKLLKILEDPVSDASFILCFTDIGVLPPTVRGRINDFIELNPDSSAAHIDYLVSCGYTPLNAGAAVRASQGIASLAMVLVKNYDNAVKVQKFWETAESEQLGYFFVEILEEIVNVWEDHLKNSLKTEKTYLAKMLLKTWFNLREEYLMKVLHKNISSNTHKKLLKNINDEVANINKIRIMLRNNVALSYVVSYYVYSRHAKNLQNTYARGSL